MNTRQNPVVVIVGAGMALVQAILLLIALLVEIEPEVQAAIWGIVTAAATFLLAILTQARYTTPWNPDANNTVGHVIDLRERNAVLSNLASQPPDPR